MTLVVGKRRVRFLPYLFEALLPLLLLLPLAQLLLAWGFSLSSLLTWSFALASRT